MAWTHGLAFGLAVCLLATLGRATYTTPEEDRLMQWVIEEGGVLRATIGRNAQGVRGIFTTEDIRQGETVVQIPEHIVLSLRAVAAADDATFLLKEMMTPCSRLRPYMDVLPKEDGVLTGYNFPEEYVKYLADDHLEELVNDSFQRHAIVTWQGKNKDGVIMTIPEAAGRNNITLPYWLYVVSLLSSRTFSIRKNVLSMVPFLDLMNHDPRDFNQLGNEHTETGEIRLIAGKDLAKGEEVTITYGDMRSDELLLYYGFIDTVTQPPRLFMVDHRDYKPYENVALDNTPLTGPPEVLSQELERLRAILRKFERKLASLGPVPEQPHPQLAATLRALHEQRRTTLRAEIERLEGLLAGGGEL